jgi:hypothetical protein
LVTKSEGEIAGTRPSTTLNINIRRWAVLLFSILLSVNPVHGKMYLIQHYVIKYVSEL